MQYPRNHPQASLISLAEEAKVSHMPMVQHALFAALMDDNQDLISDIRTALAMKAGYEKMFGVPFMPPTDEVCTVLEPGKKYFFIGTIVNDGRPFIYPVDACTKHMTIIGGTGTGKSNEIASITLQSLEHGITVWAYDRDKVDTSI